MITRKLTHARKTESIPRTKFDKAGNDVFAVHMQSNIWQNFIHEYWRKLF